MSVSPSSLKQPGPQVVVARRARPARTQKTWIKEKRRGVAAGIVVALLLGLLLSGYGVHSHMSHAAARMDALKMQAARDTEAALRNGPVLFLPMDGNICRRRVIDNATWKLRNDGDVVCDEAVGVPQPEQQHKVEKRLGAIRDTFQSRAVGKMD